jgi:hypothetical protein
MPPTRHKKSGLPSHDFRADHPRRFIQVVGLSRDDVPTVARREAIIPAAAMTHQLLFAVWVEVGSPVRM